MEQMMTVRECAKVLNLKPWAVYQKTKKGFIPSVRIGRVIRIRPEQLEAYLEANQGQAR
jgi:excisionase family DNA binding protein